MLKLISKYSFLFDTGGVLYVMIELAWRGWSHWTMFVLGGLCFIYLGLINEALSWDMPLWQQIWIGAVGITALEFLTGCVVNLWLGWGVWDYSGIPGNILGQICPAVYSAVDAGEPSRGLSWTTGSGTGRLVRSDHGTTSG